MVVSANGHMESTRPLSPVRSLSLSHASPEARRSEVRRTRAPPLRVHDGSSGSPLEAVAAQAPASARPPVGRRLDTVIWVDGSFNQFWWRAKRQRPMPSNRLTDGVGRVRDAPRVDGVRVNEKRERERDGVSMRSDEPRARATGVDRCCIVVCVRPGLTEPALAPGISGCRGSLLTSAAMLVGEGSSSSSSSSHEEQGGGSSR